MSFGGMTIIFNKPGPGMEPHIARLNGELLCTEKGGGGGRERRKVDNCVVDWRIIWTGQKQEILCTLNFKKMK